MGIYSYCLIYLMWFVLEKTLLSNKSESKRLVDVKLMPNKKGSNKRESSLT